MACGDSAFALAHLARNGPKVSENEEDTSASSEAHS